ncbi:DUF1295 domain-containing protein [bacterium]|nr:DUF1295 domain-containing protein [bacterium]
MVAASIVGGLAVYMCIAFGIALVRKDNGIADVAYGGALIVCAWSSSILGTPSVLGTVLTALVTLWGMRLMIRIARKNWGKPEDFRYRAWRESWGQWFVLRSFFQIYMLQGAIAAIIVLPVTAVNLYGASAHILSITTGVVLWAIGFLFEVIADSQLDSFLRNPENKGKLMQYGLWNYSRHPNYFGESMMWWAIAFLAIVALTPSFQVLAFLLLSSPVLITWLLLRVSGIPMLEKKMAAHPDWSLYAARTNAFIPWFPKKS